MSKSGIVYSLDHYGHRQMYTNTICKITNFKYLMGKPSVPLARKLLTCRDAVIFITIDDAYLFFLICAIFRALMGRKTLGLQLEAVRQIRPGSNKRYARMLSQKVMRKISLISIISIIPYELLPDLKSITKEWIFDPAFWDLNVVSQNSQGSWSQEEIEKINEVMMNHDKIVLYIGTITNRKGFIEFLSLVNHASLSRKKIGFIAAGLYHKSLDLKYKREFEDRGGVLIDRYLSESEVLFLQTKAGFFWGCYPASFDQSSGIAGRAYQLDKHVIVRRSSLAADLMRMLDGEFIEYEYGKHDYLIAAIINEEKNEVSKYPVSYCMKHSVEVINNYI